MRFLQGILVMVCCWYSFAQQTAYVDFKRADVKITVEPDSSLVKGNVTYEFLISKKTDSVYLDSRHMTFGNIVLIKEGKKPAKIIPSIVNDGSHLILYTEFKKKTTYRLKLEYEASPKKALYFLKRNGESQVWTQGQGKYTSNWLPSVDDTNDKIEFDLQIAAKAPYQVIANGAFKDLYQKELESDTFIWQYDMTKPMPSYLAAFVVGKYNLKRETSKSGVPIELYYYAEDSLKVEPTYRYTKQMFDFLEEEIGAAFPWQNYKQVPVKDFLYSGMENTSLTIFSDAFMVDTKGFNDKNYVNVNAHELAHQWFGNLVTAKSGEHHWLQEGFATYYALLAEKEIFGKDYYMWQLYKSAQDLLRQDQSSNGTSLLNPKASSLTFYQRGAWVVHMLRQMIGDSYFKQAVKNYLNTYAFDVVTTANFIYEVEDVSGYDLSQFVETWIASETFPYDEAMEHLKAKSLFIQEYLMVDCELKNSKCDYYLSSEISDEAKAKIISQVPERVTAPIFKNGLKVRQAIAKHLKTIPESLKPEYEKLLNDASYVTLENALYNLWLNFPEDRTQYLGATQSIFGLPDYNVRQLWLVLALNTEDYNVEEKQAYYEELVNYTSNIFGFETRQLAFSYLNSMEAFNKTALLNLKESAAHHNWRFRNYAKELIEVLSQIPDLKAILEE